MTSRIPFSVRALRGAALAGAIALAGLPAAAHVVLEWPAALAGTAYKASFKVGHGCGASPTRQIVVDIPAGVQGARPMPRPGWDLVIERAALATPYLHHGKTVTEDVVRVTWTARTPDDQLQNAHYDEFVLHAQLPAQAGPLYWPVVQACDPGRIDWTEVPRPGQNPAELKAPAAVLEILPAGHAGAHSH